MTCDYIKRLRNRTKMKMVIKGGRAEESWRSAMQQVGASLKDLKPSIVLHL